MSENKLSHWRLNSPFAQNFICGVVLALAPGMFTALADLGAGGTQASNTKVSSTVAAILYAIYTFTGWFSALLLNTIGPRWTMTLGAIGYPISAVVLGVSAGWLWTTSGYCITSYSTEAKRGLYLAVQGTLSAFGSILGSAITLGIVAKLPINATGTSVPTAVYASMTALMICSPNFAAFFLVDPGKIIRPDGTKVAEFRNTHTTSLKREFMDVVSVVKDWRLMLLIPVFFASDVATVAPSMNAYAFNLRSRTLLAFINTLAGPPTVICLWPLLDNPRFGRKTRGISAVLFLGLLVFGAWAGLLGWMKGKSLDRLETGPNYDRTDNPEFVGFAIVYFLTGAVSGIYGSVILWLLSSFTNSPAKLAASVGLMKGTIAAGICVIFAIDSTLLAWGTEIAYAFAIQGAGVLIMLFLCITQVTETNYFKEEDVVVPVVFLEKADGKDAIQEIRLHHQDNLDPALAALQVTARDKLEVE